MSDIITTAGLQGAFSNDTRINRRAEAIKEIRSKLRKADATDDEWDDALDALIELSKDKMDEVE